MVGDAVLSDGGPGGTDVIRGVAFQLAQALSDVVELVVDGDGDAVVIEGAVDVVDYEVLDRGGRRIAVRQAKTRREPGTWGARELARILCAWGEVDDAAETEFAFVTDAPLNDSGRRLDELINAMRAEPDEHVLRRTAAALGRGGVQLPPLDVVRRVRILTRMGTTESILGQAAMRILTLMQRARLATLDDAENATNALFRRLFIIGGNVRSQAPHHQPDRGACRARPQRGELAGRGALVAGNRCRLPRCCRRKTAADQQDSSRWTWCRSRLLPTCSGFLKDRNEMAGENRVWTPCWRRRRRRWWVRPGRERPGP